MTRRVTLTEEPIPGDDYRSLSFVLFNATTESKHIETTHKTATVSDALDEKIDLAIHTHPETEHYVFRNAPCCRSANWIILYFDITKAESFATANTLRQEIIRDNPSAKFILVGQKKGPEAERAVSIKDAQKVLGPDRYIECSAGDEVGVDEAIEIAVLKTIPAKKRSFEIETSAGEPKTAWDSTSSFWSTRNTYFAVGSGLLLLSTADEASLWMMHQAALHTLKTVGFDIAASLGVVSAILGVLALTYAFAMGDEYSNNHTRLRRGSLEGGKSPLLFTPC
jgi:hypothetical protein